MGHLHVSKMKFRHPVPDVYSQQKIKKNGKLRPLTDDSACMDFQVSMFFLLSSNEWISEFRI